MARKYHTGKYVPINPKKYCGDVNAIVYRSGWEKKLMYRFDTNPAIVYWSSETIVIPYYSEVDHKLHRYFVDFAVVMKTANGGIQKYLLECKPHAQTLPPTGKRKTKALVEALATYSVNQSKWKQARAWAEKNGMIFEILTEKNMPFLN